VADHNARATESAALADPLTFRPLTQTILSNLEIGVHGNCLATCVAAITGADDVPNFAQEGTRWFLALWAWGDENGWDIYTAKPSELPPGPSIATGQGPRGFKHAVVWGGGTNGMVVWDPRPSRVGLVGPPENWVRVTRDR